MPHQHAVRSHERWAHLRFAVVGPLLASPPAAGELKAELARLAARVWQHPVSGQPVHFAISTIERWYYQARHGLDPVAVLRRKIRSDSGQQQALGVDLGEALRRQHAAHPRWSYQLHLDNLAVLVAEQPSWGPLPSYASLRRYMVTHGWLRRRRVPGGQRPGERLAAERREARETRSYEAEYVAGLWHLDFHHGSLKILSAQGEWVRPVLLAILDDRSRLACHAQWYLSETAASLVHGLAQAFHKRGLPRALLTDNGGPMLAAETTQGLQRLAVVHHTTLSYSPHQNGKQEVFWGQVEGRLLAMLEDQPDLTLGLLNEATLAWVEMEYQRTQHSETGQAPLTRWLDGPAVSRPCPETNDLRFAFTAAAERTQRQSDGTLSLEGTRFEVPARYRHLRRLALRYASWDLRSVWLVDPRTGAALERLYPLDRARNAEGVRRPLAPPSQPTAEIAAQPAGIAPLLRQLMADYAATGLPPAYIAYDEEQT
ncbi:MAG TPA: DDE-type integrase/transposase/recombinase [Thermoanaerobaculia bacterium]|nr:DDE-type integrase/transposase/recombinase [Thermoanaerobaculia bacterium]